MNSVSAIAASATRKKPSSMPVILTDRPELRMNMRIGAFWRIRAS